MSVTVAMVLADIFLPQYICCNTLKIISIHHYFEIKLVIKSTIDLIIKCIIVSHILLCITYHTMPHIWLF